jgi:hypothetical protein
MPENTRDFSGCTAGGAIVEVRLAGATASGGRQRGFDAGPKKNKE